MQNTSFSCIYFENLILLVLVKAKECLTLDKLLLLILLSPYTAWVPLGICAVYVIHKKYKFESNPLNFGLVCMAIISGISGALNKDILSIGGSGILLMYMTMNIWFSNHYNTSDKVESLVKKVWHLSIITGFIGILEKLIASFWDITWYVKWYWNPTFFPSPENYRILSTFGNPNIAGDWFAALIIISFYFVDKEKDNFKSQLKYILGGILFTVNLVFTGSKGALVAFVVAVIGYCFVKNSKKMWHYLTGLMIFIIVTFGYSVKLFETMNFRNKIWMKCIDLIGQKPIFGWGFFGIYKEIHEVHGHNIWISITTSLGFVGLVIFVLMTLYVIERSFVLIKHNVPMGPLFTSIMLLLLIHGIVDFTILAPQTGILFFASLQIINSLAAEQEALAPAVSTYQVSLLKQSIDYMKLVLVHLLKIH